MMTPDELRRAEQLSRDHPAMRTPGIPQLAAALDATMYGIAAELAERLDLLIASKPDPHEVHIPIPEGRKIKVCRGPQDPADPKPGEPDVGMAVLKIERALMILQGCNHPPTVEGHLTSALRVLQPEEKP